MVESRIRKNIPALTGLRWIAALLVILRHNPPSPDSRLYPVFSNGHSGVTLFFVLSGFVLSVNYFDKFSTMSFGTLKEFYAARFARIYPLYIVVLVGYGIVFGFEEWSVLIQHIFLIQAWSSDSDISYAMNGPGWSLGVEAFFYILFPFLIITVRPLLSSRARALALLVCSLLLPLIGAVIFQFSNLQNLAENDPNSMWRWLYRNPALRLGDFLSGIALASIYLNRQAFRFNQSRRFLVYLPWFGLFVALSLRLLTNSPFGLDFVFAVASCGIIFTAVEAQDSSVSRILSTRPLVLLGEFSFAAYLVHVPIRQAVFTNIFGNGFTVGAVTSFVMYVALVVVVSALLHYVVERPARILIRRLLGTMN